MSAQSTRLKRTLASIGLVAGVGVGAAGVAAAASNSTSSTPSGSTAASQVAGGQQQDPNYQASVTVPEQANQSEADEAKALEAAATTSPDQARQAALAADPGTAGTVSLDNENGNVVYSVEITDSTGMTDVKVDAGNGTVLAKGTPSNETGGGAETPGSTTEAQETVGK
jgi:uncharacterized membrane protein YkoI